MKELLKNAQDFKIIPNNFKSSGAFNITEITDNEIKAKLILIDEKELEDYPIGSNVEVFGVNALGLLYFETKILSREGNNISLKMTQDYSIIQRREYSRVGFNQGQVIFKDIPNEAILNIEDIVLIKEIKVIRCRLQRKKEVRSENICWIRSAAEIQSLSGRRQKILRFRRHL